MVGVVLHGQMWWPSAGINCQGVVLVPSSVIGSGNSTLTGNRTPGSAGLASSDGAATFPKQAASSNLSTVRPIQGSG